MDIQPEKSLQRVCWSIPLVTIILIGGTQSGALEVFEDVDGNGFLDNS